MRASAETRRRFSCQVRDPELVEPDGVGLAARVAVDEADAIDRQVDRAAVVLELQEVLGHAADGELLEPAVAADAVLVVDDEIPLGDLAEIAETRRLRRRPRLARRARAEDLLLGDDDQAIGRQREPAPQRSDQHRQRRLPAATTTARRDRPPRRA